MLKLRKIREDDLAMVMNWRMDPDVTKYMYTDPKLDMEKQRMWFKAISVDETSKYWIINYDDIDVGLISITGFDSQNKRCSWAYYVADKNMRGKGIGVAVECNVYDYVFNRLGLEKLCCEVFSFNDKVVQLHEKFGSRREGYLRNHIIKDGKSYDVVSLAILKAEWTGIRKGFSYPIIDIEE